MVFSVRAHRGGYAGNAAADHTRCALRDRRRAGSRGRSRTWARTVCQADRLRRAPGRRASDETHRQGARGPGLPPWTAGRIRAKSLDAREASRVPSRQAFSEGGQSLRRPLRQRSEVDESTRTAERIRRVLLRRPAREGVDDIMPLDDVEHAYIVAVLHLCRGNQSRTAVRLGIGRSTLLRRIRSLKLRRMLRELEREKAAAKIRQQATRAPRARRLTAARTRKRPRPSLRLSGWPFVATRSRRRRSRH